LFYFNKFKIFFWNSGFSFINHVLDIELVYHFFEAISRYPLYLFCFSIPKLPQTKKDAVSIGARIKSDQKI
jgi:hypothetical protein